MSNSQLDEGSREEVGKRLQDLETKLSVETRIKEIEAKLDEHDDRVSVLETDVNNVATCLMKESLDREIQQGKSMLKITKFPWKWENLKPKTKDVEQAFKAREDFWNRLRKEVFVSTNLVSQREADSYGSSFFTDVKPASWQSKEGGALDVTLADRTLRHNVLDRLSGRRDIKFGIRAWLPNIVNARYNELLRIRSEMGKANGLFVDTVVHPPYVILRQKMKQNDGSFKRTTLNVNEKFNDKRLADPVKNYLNWSQHPPIYGQAPAPSGGASASTSTGPAAPHPPAAASLSPTASIRAAKRSIDEGDQQPPARRDVPRRDVSSAFGSDQQRNKAQQKNRMDTT